MPGEVIAITGNTGRSTGPHLHLTCKFQNRYINPGILLQFVRETKEEAVARLGIFWQRFSCEFSLWLFDYIDIVL